ncbi:hypothetical protein JW710_01905 [Candidatus Dojkabacteria bacterium]|nr:hypothetical protein [Candidatus Dojkabacteria bacterium]
MQQYDLERPTDLGLLVVIGGPGGSGSSTIANLLARKWGLHRVYAGEIMRNTDMSKDFEKFLERRVETHPEIDKNVDRFLVKMSYYPDMLIEGKFFAAIATSMGIPTTVKIWITASLSVRVMRILKRESYATQYPDISPKHEVFKKTRAVLMRRQTSDIKRCQALYHLDLSKPDKFNDIIIDSSKLNISRTIKATIDAIKNDERLALRFKPEQLRY